MDEPPNKLSEEEKANHLYQATLELIQIYLIDDPLGDY